ncbi:MAG: ABC transporter ATP-binding protein, partial [Actinomycetes bacterium]
MAETGTVAPAAAHGGTDPAPTVRPARLRTLLGYLAEHRGVLAVVVALSLAGAVLALAQPLAVNRIIGAVEKGEPLGRTILVLVALVVGSGLLGAIEQYLLQRTAEGVVLTTRRRLVAHLLRLPVREYDTRRAGDLVSRVGSDTTLVRSALTGGLIDALGGALVFTGSLVAMALLDPLLLTVTLAVVAIALVGVLLASARIQKLTQESQAAVGRLGAGVERALSAVRTIRAANATQRESAHLAAEAGQAYRLGVDVARTQALRAPVAGLAGQGAFLGVLALGGYRVAAGTLPVADLVTFILFLFMVIMPLAQAFGAILTVRAALGALARIEDVLAVGAEDADEPHLPSETLRAAESPPAASGPPALAFAGVDFAYRAGDPVLRSVSFAVPAGSTTAVVGPSGAGKSTLLALVERFYDPDAGAVLLSGADLRTLPRTTVRAGIGYVEQTAPVLAGTIRANLVLGVPDADDAACWRALTEVNLRERIERHPAGLDAAVGDDGAGLSGGERQRLAIARTLLASAPLLLLDEPTASLDSRNEQVLHRAVHAAAE